MKKRAKQALLIGFVALFLVLIINPLGMFTIIVDNIPGSPQSNVDVSYHVRRPDGSEVNDGDTVRDTITVSAVFTCTNAQMQYADLYVDGSKWIDMTLRLYSPSGQTYDYVADLDTTQLSDGAHEVQIHYEWIAVDDNGVTLPDDRHKLEMSVLEFSTGSGGGGDGGNGGDGGDGVGTGWGDVLTWLFALIIVGVAVYFMVRKVR